MPPKRNTPEARDLDWNALLQTAITAPGGVGNTYNRLYDYSFLNQMLLLMQGVEPQPVATYKRWQSLGRQVLKGSVAKEIVRPVVIEKKNDQGEKTGQKLVMFKAVRCIFGINDTEGPELPPVELPNWNLNDAERNLNITRIPYKIMEGNTQGYSLGRSYALNPLARNPAKTTLHEFGHIVLGHTAEPRMQDYLAHRGVWEFQAESTAYLTLNELGELPENQAYESRGYIQNWLAGQTPPAEAIREVFKATDTILKAGRLAIGAAEAVS